MLPDCLWSQSGGVRLGPKMRPSTTVPYRALLPQGGFNNRIVAARMIDMDPVAHAAVRVMVDPQPDE